MNCAYVFSNLILYPVSGASPILSKSRRSLKPGMILRRSNQADFSEPLKTAEKQGGSLAWIRGSFRISIGKAVFFKKIG